MKKRTFPYLLCVVFCVAFIHVPSDALAQGGRSVQRITGTAVGIGGRLGGRTRQFTLVVYNYSPTNQVRELNEALRRGGQDEMLRVISELKAGRIEIGTGVGVDANVVMSDPWEGGTKLTVFYERNITFYELRSGARSQDYPIGYAEIFLDRNGKGKGTLIAAARVRLKDGNTWEVEDFGTFPAKLMGLRSTGRVEPR
jgi:hypothetical protein